jgi:S-adenosylmethionine synthetase
VPASICSVYTASPPLQVSKSELIRIIKKNFDMRPGAIVKELDLKKPIYQSTASYGHFGRPGFTWETPKVCG